MNAATPRIPYPHFIPDQESHRAMVATLERVAGALAAQPRGSQPPELMLALRDLHPRRVYEAASFFVRHRITLLAAIEEDCDSIFRLRIDGMGLRDGLDPLIPWVGLHGATRVIGLLGRRGIDLSVPEPGGHRMTALHWAVEHSSLEPLTALLRAPGLRVDRPNARGLTALGYAVLNHRRAAARMLLSAGAQVESSLLVLALLHRGPVGDLLDRAPRDIDRADPATGLTPLHAAILMRDEPVARRLIELGADPDVRTQRRTYVAGLDIPEGLSARGLAERTDQPEIFREPSLRFELRRLKVALSDGAAA